ncbi:MAG: hypothetical protein LBV33_08805, partial [Lachnospiraceae bacterium]|nr:hypothetical protein [Lachnospiraceae bacterium]
GVSDTREYPAISKQPVAEDQPALVDQPASEDQPEMEISIKPIDVSQYNTINLQQVVAESMKELLSDPEQKKKAAQATEPIVVKSGHNGMEVFFGDTAELKTVTEGKSVEIKASERLSETVVDEPSTEASKTNQPLEDDAKELPGSPAGTIVKEKPEVQEGKAVLTDTGIIKVFNKKSGYDEILTQESDGQIGLVVPETASVEKQITGQLKIDDILAEWERQKKEIEQKRVEEVRKKVRKQTDNLFADFDEATKSGLLEKLEKAMLDAVMREEKSNRPNVIKVADIGMDTISEQSLEEPTDKTGVEAADEEVQRILAMEDNPDGDDDTIEEAEEGLVEEQPTEESFLEEDPIEDPEEDPIEESAAEVNSEANLINEPDGEELNAEALDIANKLAVGTKQDQAEEQAENQVTDDAEKYETLNGHNNVTAPSTSGNHSGTVRELSEDERNRFGRFIQHKKTRQQLINVIENISLAAFCGNCIVTGEEAVGTMKVAKELIKGVQQSDNNFSGRVAKISGELLNKRDIPATFSKLENGAIIIEQAAQLKNDTVKAIIKALEQESTGHIVVLTDKKALLNQLVEQNPSLEKVFDLRVDLEALDDQTLVEYGQTYALEQEYAIDNFGVLALHTRIAEMQTSDHEVTIAEVREIIDEAIYYAGKKNPKHFFDILVGKRYDKEDMVILRESDFMHN